MRRKNNAAVCTDIGNGRHENQDNFYLNGIFDNVKKKKLLSKSITFKRNALFAVADGMGGQSFGGYASKTVMRFLKSYFFKNISDFDENIELCINAINSELCSQAQKTGTKIGTTIVLLSIEKDKARVYNIGDSRCYLYRKGSLSQLSKDHTIAEELVSMNILTPDKAKKDYRKHCLTQYLGLSQDEMLLSIYKSPEIILKKGDRLLLCSDGVTEKLNDLEIKKLLSEKGNSRRVANKIINKVLDKNVGDNVTALVVNIEDTLKDKIFRRFICYGLIILFLTALILMMLFIFNKK